MVSLEQSLNGCERILNDEFADYPESALYMIGAVDEAKQKMDAAHAASDIPAVTEAKHVTDNDET